MILSRTPLRISFCGGGTDIRDYYAEHGGAVVSSTIDKFVYIVAHNRFAGNIRLNYSKTEEVDSVNAIEHPLLREGLRSARVHQAIELASLADIPSKGSGLGSSSAFLVGLLNTLNAFKGEARDAEYLAREACRVEIDVLGEPIGKQDQYAAAYGNLNFIEFRPDETVRVESLNLAPSVLEELDDNLLLFYTGVTRSASTVLIEQKRRSQENVEALHALKEAALEARNLLKRGSLNEFGLLLDKGWQEKKKLARNISNPDIDRYYAKALDAGALGGKVCGGGNGGFLLFYCEPDRQERLRAALSGLRETRFHLERTGTKITYQEE